MPVRLDEPGQRALWNRSAGIFHDRLDHYGSWRDSADLRVKVRSKDSEIGSWCLHTKRSNSVEKYLILLPGESDKEEEARKQEAQDQLALLSSIFHMLNQSDKEGESPIRMLKQKIEEYERTITALRAENKALKKALAEQLEKADRDQEQ